MPAAEFGNTRIGPLYFVVDVSSSMAGELKQVADELIPNLLDLCLERACMADVV